MEVRNEEEFGRAIGGKEEQIRVHGHLAPKLERLYTMNEVLWGMCVGCLTVAMVMLVKIKPKKNREILYEPPGHPAGRNLMEQTMQGLPDAGRFGTSLLISAMEVAESCGGMGHFRSFRKDYEMEPGVSNPLVFRRKKKEGKPI